MKRLVVRADVYGFCSGVRRAVDLALRAGAKAGGSDVRTLGQLVHNRRVMEMLDARGVSAINAPDEIAGGTVIIRAHGAPAGTVEALVARGIHVIDATCPKVARSHAIIEKYAKRGYCAIVAGEREHDEVQGLISRIDSAYVVENAEEATQLQCAGPAIVIAQTTFQSAEFERICSVLRKRLKQVEVYDTVCPAMEERCEALDRLALSVEAIIIIGGKNSANTKRLFERAKRTGLPSSHVEGVHDLPDQVFGYKSVGITAGASTPDYVVDEVQERLESVPKPGDLN